jgi:hypothetical protein
MLTYCDPRSEWQIRASRSSFLASATSARRSATWARHCILAVRHEVYIQARERNPARWSGHTRDWSHSTSVTLNPERDSIVAATRRSEDIQPLAA